MDGCEICGRNEEDLSLLQANHKELGYVMVCQDCWEKLYSKNLFVSSGGSGGSGGFCPTCG